MSMTDPIADLLTRIRNASKERHEKLEIPASRLKANIVRVLKEEGYIKNFRLQREDGKPVIKVYLKYSDSGEAVIQGIRRISRPGLRRYAGYEEIPKPLGGAGIAIVSTSKGVLTGQKARLAKIGGEILCEVW
jgi:small subunit ribosomal protein S8